MDLKAKINKDEVQKYYDESKTKLAVTREKINELNCFKQFYEQLNNYQKVKIDMTQLNRELHQWIVNLYNSSEERKFEYFDIEVIKEKETNELVGLIIEPDTTNSLIKPLVVNVSFQPILSFVE